MAKVSTKLTLLWFRCSISSGACQWMAGVEEGPLGEGGPFSFDCAFRPSPKQIHLQTTFSKKIFFHRFSCANMVVYKKS